MEYKKLFNELVLANFLMNNYLEEEILESGFVAS